MTPSERRAAGSLALIFGFRMAGLFMILPVFALYAEHLEQVTPAMVGLAIGIYGLTQALLQIPFGMISDRVGRKPVIFAGLLLFALGSVVAALAETVYGVIAGRALQGSGAIAGALMATLADLTRDEQRTKAMAFMGISIGASFALAMVLGPLLNTWVGVPGIFWFTALLALAGVVVLFTLVPTPSRTSVHRDTEPVWGQFGSVLRDGQLLRLDFGIFSLHLMLTAIFVVLPVALRDLAGLPVAQHGYLYLAVLTLSVALMLPLIIVAEKKGLMKPIFIGAVALIGVAELVLWQWHGTLLAIGLALLIFFTAFNVLEASLPSLISRKVRPDSKGTAMGVYSSSQFLGAFVGGAAGGWLHGHYGIDGVFVAGAALAGIWLVVALGMQPPRKLRNVLLHVGALEPDQAHLLAGRLSQVAGVTEAVVVREEEVAYLKVDSTCFDEAALEQFSPVKA
ncbi:MAG: MFS transporter [Proteobacteria bacterium]|nr:MAG: MFS transporter [Pseudomonadota bacterium]